MIHITIEDGGNKHDANVQTTSRAIAMMLALQRHFGRDAHFELDREHSSAETWRGDLVRDGSRSAVRIDFDPTSAAARNGIRT